MKWTFGGWFDSGCADNWGSLTSSCFCCLFTALLGLLGVLDFLFVNHACHSIITRGASVQLVFGFEVWFQFNV